MKYLAVIAALLTAPAYAQEPPCFSTEDVYAELDKNGSTRIMWADMADGKTVEIFVSDKGWIMFVSLPNSTTCYITGGDDYGVVPNV